MGLRLAPEGERELTQDWLQTSQPRGESRVYCSSASRGGKLVGGHLRHTSLCPYCAGACYHLLVGGHTHHI
jgi:hypothetical protein